MPAEETRGFALADFAPPAGAEPLAPPKQDAGSAIPEPQITDTTGDTPPNEPETPEKLSPDDAPEPEKPSPDDDPKTDEEDDDPPVNLSEAMDRQASKTKKQEEEKKAETKRLADEAAAEEKAKKEAEATGKPDTAERDADLKDEADGRAHPKTRKIITEIKAKARTARDERDAYKTRLDAAEKRVAEAEEKLKSTKLPESVETELKSLKERVRELDITKDPEIEAKYDKRISSNNESIVGILKANGYAATRDKDGKITGEDPKAIADLVKSGLTLKNLQPLITALDKAEAIEDAEAIREALRENNRLSRDKTAEIEKWKGNYDQRIQQREQTAKQAQEEHVRAIDEHSKAVLDRDMDALNKELPYLRKPAGPAPNDPPAVAKTKQAQLDAYNAAEAKIQAEVNTLKTAGVPPDKIAQVAGKITANAVQAIVLKQHVVPQAMRDIAALNARNKQLEAEIAAMRSAGRISRVQGSTPSAGDANNGRPAPQSLEEALGAGPGS